MILDVVNFHSSQTAHSLAWRRPGQYLKTQTLVIGKSGDVVDFNWSHFYGQGKYCMKHLGCRVGVEVLRVANFDLNGAIFVGSTFTTASPSPSFAPLVTSLQNGTIGWATSGWTDSQTLQDVTFARFRAPGMLPLSPCAR